MKQEINQERLDRIHELTDEISKAKDHASELLRIAKDRFSDKKHKVMREGKEIEVTEKILWDEVFYIGPASDAGKILQKEHPEVFEAYRKQDQAANELKKFTITELGIDYTQMTLSDYLKLTEGVYDYLMESGRYVAKPWYKRIFG